MTPESPEALSARFPVASAVSYRDKTLAKRPPVRGTVQAIVAGEAGTFIRVQLPGNVLDTLPCNLSPAKGPSARRSHNEHKQ